MTEPARTDVDRADFAGCFSDQPVPTDPGADLARARRARRTRTQRRFAGAVATLTVAVAVLVGAPSWGGRPQLAVPAAPADHVLPSWPGCAAAGAFDQSSGVGPPPQTSTVPADFHAVQVHQCIQDSRQADNGDQVQVNLEQEAPVTPNLLAYLARPSLIPQPLTHKGPGKYICPANLVPVPWLVLIDRDGGYIAPTVPTDGCTHPLDWDTPDGPPYATLDYRDVSVTPVRVTESLAARTAGCSMRVRNMLTFQPGPQRPRPALPDLTADARVRRCDYVADPADDSGTFVAGGPITAAELAALLTATRTDPGTPRPPCAAAAAHFTVLTDDHDKSTIYLETGGCRRVLREK